MTMTKEEAKTKFVATQLTHHFDIELFTGQTSLQRFTHVSTYEGGTDIDPNGAIVSNMRCFSYDMFNKTITIVLRETCNFEVVGCISAFTKLLDVKLNCLNSKGKILKSVLFGDSELIGHTCNYDYTKMDLVEHTLTFEFENVKII